MKPQAIIKVRYRFAEPGELSAGRVADIRPGSEPDSVHAIVEPGEATQELLDELTELQTSQMRSGQWYRLPDTAENRIHPRRVLSAGWRLTPAEELPDGSLCLSVEAPGRHTWHVQEGHASPLVAAQFTWLITRMVRNEIWIQERGTGAE
ncbi:hypothetical protein QMZ92_16220 [Streptomyces sp. HNM0645]|uniref:hypothetical protein n=1 Tax=Streptomyces sp. HNM0645 TaxID=2782343 RepID=UPI0024B72624|nr:hypothetical protein [Streptomyces sp. HNM0645]MDI9885880.1 hypothetical protein [Streptomyces sp. HNM0645]